MLAELLTRIHREIGRTPVLEAEIEGDIPVVVERYLYQANQVAVGGAPYLVLLSFLGGRAVKEGEVKGDHYTLIPTQLVLLPPNTATQWHYSGAVDYALFYIPDRSSWLVNALYLLAESYGKAIPFSDSLVSVASHQLLSELKKPSSENNQFIQLLLRVMLEQGYRTLSASADGLCLPRHANLSRLQEVLNYINSNLAGNLSVSSLAKIAGVNVSYFRKIFYEATGSAPHDYVQNIRLTQARKLLAISELPVAQIAQDTGFSNQSHFTSRFKDVHGITPAKFRKSLASKVSRTNA